MKKFIFVLLALSVILAQAPQTIFAKSPFNDIDGHWAKETIEKWADSDIISGYPNGSFKPNQYVTRAELAKMLTKAFDLKKTAEPENTSDLDKSAWYYPYIECAWKYMPDEYCVMRFSSTAPFQDREDGCFLPDTYEIRLHIFESLVEIEKERKNLEIELPDFYDVVVKDLEDDPSYNSVICDSHGRVGIDELNRFNYTWLAKKLGIMKGVKGYLGPYLDMYGESFLPYNNITRAEIITAIDRMLED